MKRVLLVLSVALMLASCKGGGEPKIRSIVETHYAIPEGVSSEDDKEFVDKYIYTYAINGSLIEKEYHSKDESEAYKERMEYDINGMEKETTIHNLVNDGIEAIRTYVYNSDNQRTEIVLQDRIMKLISRIEITYNRFGEEVENRFYNASGELDSITKFVYNEDHHNVGASTYNANNELVYKWDYHERLYAGLSKWTTYVVSQDKSYECSSKYEYDDRGIWNKRMDYVDNKLDGVVEREIEYY